MSVWRYGVCRCMCIYYAYMMRIEAWRRTWRNYNCRDRYDKELSSLYMTYEI